MSPADFERLQALMATRAGYRLTRDRMQLANHRLGPVARREGFDSVEAMLQSLADQPVASLGWAVIEALLNGETWFRRDRPVFDSFAREVLPALAKARGRPVRIWSAGTSTGQEAYSLAMAALDAGVDAEVHGIDLAGRSIEKARSGLYTAFEIQKGLSAATMLRWFEQVEDGWRALPALRQTIAFTRGNLLDEPSDTTQYDVIFCRHLLKDMEPGRRSRLLDALDRRLLDDGCLFLGLDERPEGETVAFRGIAGRPGLYIKADRSLSRAA